VLVQAGEFLAGCESVLDLPLPSGLQPTFEMGKTAGELLGAAFWHCLVDLRALHGAPGWLSSLWRVSASWSLRLNWMNSVPASAAGTWPGGI